MQTQTTTTENLSVSAIMTRDVGQTVALSNLKTGMNGVRLMTRKEWKDAEEAKTGKKLKRAECERLHREYLTREGVKGNVNIAARIASGQILITGVKEWEESGKGQIAFINAAQVMPKAPEVKVDDAYAAIAKERGMSVEDVKALFAKK